jgi:hypothetical protein
MLQAPTICLIVWKNKNTLLEITMNSQQTHHKQLTRKGNNNKQSTNKIRTAETWSPDHKSDMTKNSNNNNDAQ